MKISTIFLIIAILIFSQCQKIEENHLLGKWRTIEVLEQNQPLTVDVEQIYIQFTPTYYEFHSTLKHKEAGSYFLQSNLLFTKDTIQQEALEKAVEITKLTTDSLFIRMNEKGMERIWKMVKVE